MEAKADRWTDGLRKIPRVLDDFVPFKAVAQKANLRVPRADLMVLRAHLRVLRA